MFLIQIILKYSSYILVGNMKIKRVGNMKIYKNWTDKLEKENKEIKIIVGEKKKKKRRNNSKKLGQICFAVSDSILCHHEFRNYDKRFQNGDN
jgi:hypothetical protein